MEMIPYEVPMLHATFDTIVVPAQYVLIEKSP